VKTKVSPAVVGLFVIGAMLLALVALFSFGGVNFFAKPERFVVYFNESIHGLDLGSPVKLRGVRLGRVVGLEIRYVAERNESVVAVVCELSRNVLSDAGGREIDVSDRGELQRLIDQGLRAQLGLLGLATGLLYVELDFADPKEHPAPLSDVVDLRYAVVPAMPSAISEFQANLTEILNDLKRINFAELGGELRGLILDTRRQVNGLDLAAVSRSWVEAGASVERLANSPKLAETIENLNGAVAEVRAVLARIDGAVPPTAEQLRETLAAAERAMAALGASATEVRTFVAAQEGLGDEAAKALAQLGAAAAAVQRLADFLERNPGALLKGRAPPR
jgi:paraquat-inducible protein B